MPYRVAVTNGYASIDGSTIYGDIGFSRLSEAGLHWEVLAEKTSPVRAEQLDGFDAVLVLGPERIDESSLPALGRLRHVARYGAGFDSVDVAACSQQGVVLTNCPDAVRGPVADSAIALLYALAHNLVIKDRLVREGRWAERASWHGQGLEGATVGIIGLGGIGLETARRLTTIGLTTIAYNRSDRSREAGRLGVRQLPLDEVMSQSDFIIVTVAANPGTHHLIGGRELDLMKPTAQLINVARGSVIDEQALIASLLSGRIAGAGLDVFEHEPLGTDSPFVTMENVILSPHSLCWTNRFTQAVGASAIDSIIDASRGIMPRNAVNPDAWEGRPDFETVAG